MYQTISLIGLSVLIYNNHTLNNIFVQPMKEVVDCLKKPLKIVWGSMLIGSTVFLIGGTIAHKYYN